MAKVKINALVREQKKLAEGIFDLRLEAPEIVSQAAAGQFVSLYSGDGARLLPRPIRICGLDRKEGLLRLVYRIAGAGTEEFSHLKAGDRVEVLGPLGNGFPVEPGKKAEALGFRPCWSWLRPFPRRTGRQGKRPAWCSPCWDTGTARCF